jgi:hypothetical protein
MPKRPQQHVSGDEAILLAKRCLPPRWIVREVAQANDYGIDLEVELADSEVSGRLFKAQVRGHGRIAWTAGGSYLQPVREQTLNYWRALLDPVVLLVPDLTEEKTYWAPGKAPSGSAGIRIMSRSALPKDTARLASYVTDWIDQRSAKALLYSLPFFADAWAQVKEYKDFDFFFGIGNDDYALLHYVYSQTKLIRGALGLSTDMLPWAVWTARARAIFPSEEHLTWGIYDEVVLYIDPLVQEALAEARRQLDAEEPTSDNSSAKWWATGYHMHFVVPTDFDAEGVGFWRRIDEQLRRRGALKFDVAQAVQSSGAIRRNKSR